MNEATIKLSSFPFLFGLLISFQFTFNLGYGQTINDDVNFFNYTYDQKLVQSNQIESVTIESYVQQNYEGVHKFYFDKKGQLVKQEILDTSLHLQSAFLFYTNKHGDLILRKQIDHALNVRDSIHFIKKYDGNKLIRDSSDQVPTCSYFKYDQNNNLVACSTYVGANNRVLKIINYIPDSIGRTIRITEFVHNPGDTVGNLVSDKAISYNKSGNREIEVEKCNNENFIPLNKGTIRYDYDPKGQLIKKQTKSTTENYKYNSKGLLSEKSMLINVDDHEIELNDQYQYKFRN